MPILLGQHQLLFTLVVFMSTPSSIGVRPNAENQNLEIGNLGVLGTPGHRTPVGKKI